MSGLGNIQNNSILETNSDGRLSQLLCLSGSNLTVVGEWISPEGVDLAAVQNDPFDVIFGDSNSPGQLLVETPATNPPIMTSHEGVYTCIIPDEEDENQYLHVGIYTSSSKLPEFNFRIHEI